MSVTSLLLPVFLQVALTFALMIWMAKERGRRPELGNGYAA